MGSNLWVLILQSPKMVDRRSTHSAILNGQSYSVLGSLFHRDAGRGGTGRVYSDSRYYGTTVPRYQATVGVSALRRRHLAVTWSAFRSAERWD